MRCDLAGGGLRLPVGIARTHLRNLRIRRAAAFDVKVLGAIEAMYHAALCDCHAEGEWFACTLARFSALEPAARYLEWELFHPDDGSKPRVMNGTVVRPVWQTQLLQYAKDNPPQIVW